MVHFRSKPRIQGNPAWPTRQICEQRAGMINDAQVVERVDHHSYARHGIDMEPNVKMDHASAAPSAAPNANRSRPAKSRMR